MDYKYIKSKNVNKFTRIIHFFSTFSWSFYLFMYIISFGIHPKITHVNQFVWISFEYLVLQFIHTCPTNCEVQVILINLWLVINEVGLLWISIDLLPKHFTCFRSTSLDSTSTNIKNRPKSSKAFICNEINFKNCLSLIRGKQAHTIIFHSRVNFKENVLLLR